MDSGIVQTIYDLKEHLTGVFADNQPEITRNDTSFVAQKRAKAFG